MQFNFSIALLSLSALALALPAPVVNEVQIEERGIGSTLGRAFDKAKGIFSGPNKVELQATRPDKIVGQEGPGFIKDFQQQLQKFGTA